MNNKGFTLMELLVVVVCVGIMGTLGVTSYYGNKERLADKEAIFNLRMLQSAQKGYFEEMAGYYPNATTGNVSDIMAISSNLSVSLNNNNNRNWNYQVFSTGCVQARRNGGNQRYFNLTYSTDAEPNATMTCP